MLHKIISYGISKTFKSFLIPPPGPLCTVGPKAVFLEIVPYRAKNMPLICKVVFFGRLPLDHTRKNNQVDIFVLSWGSGDKFSK